MDESGKADAKMEQREKEDAQMEPDGEANGAENRGEAGQPGWAALGGALGRLGGHVGGAVGTTAAAALGTITEKSSTNALWRCRRRLLTR